MIRYKTVPKGILSSLFSFTVLILSFFILIGCDSDSGGGDSGGGGDTSSTTTVTDTTDTVTTTTPNSCRLTKDSSSRNTSLIVNVKKLNTRSSKKIGRVLHVDQSSVSMYQTDDYLLLDQFDSDGVTGNHRSGSESVILPETIPVLGNQFTQEARFYYDDGGEGPGQLMGSESLRAPSIEFYNHGKEIRYGFYTDGSVKFDRKIVKNLNITKAWHHIATTFDGTNYRLFLDGEEIDNSTDFQGLTPPNTEPVRIIGKKHWVGKIDELRMWNVARTQSQIQDNMTTTLVGNETGLIAYYSMDVNNNWEIIDKSTNANHAKITNAEILSRYYSNDCPNGPNDNSTCPYPTIRSVLDDVTSGDHVYIRRGRYTELINKMPLNVNIAEGIGLEDSFLKEEEKIIFEGYPNEEVIIDGTVALNDNNSNWELFSHTLDNGTSINIYKTVINFDNISREIMTPVDNITQVFVNGRYMIPAMPMNIKNPTDPTTGNPNNPEPGTVWAGIGRSPFRYPASDTNSWGSESRWGHDWYMPGKLKNLDNPEEWAFDPANNTLYLYASDNYTPTSTNVRVRVRDRFMSFLNAYNFEFKNIHFFAGSIRIENGGFWTIEDSKFSFSSDMGLRGNTSLYGTNITFRNTIFEFINDNFPWSSSRTMYPTFENVLFRYNDWFTGSAMYARTDRNYRSTKKEPGFKRGDTQWRFVTIENSFTAGIFAGYGSLIEYARLENLYDGCDCSGIQRNGAASMYSTTRNTWIINAPGLNGMRFDSLCGGNNGDIYNVVSIGNSRGLRLKGDYHDVYHVTTYDNARIDISLEEGKYCGIDREGEAEVGNWNSNLYNSIAEGSLTCSSRLCKPEGPLKNTVEIDGQTLPWMHFSNLETSGIWFGRSMSVDKNSVPNFSPPWAYPMFEMESPWIRNKSRSDSSLQEDYGKIPWNYRKQSYDFRPKKGSYLIDSGVVIPGINNGEDVDNSIVREKPGYAKTFDLNKEDCTQFNHTNLYSGQNRKYVGDAPDIGAYEYGDSVYWIPGYRYPQPSVPIPNDGALEVPIDHSLVWNYSYKKDYSNTKAIVTVVGPGVNLTKEFQYPNNVLFQSFEPGGTYNWSVTVDNVSGGNWSFKVSDKIYPLNDRSVDITDTKSLIPYQIKNLKVSKNNLVFLRFDIPSTAVNNTIKLNMFVEEVDSLNGGIEIYKFDYKNWGEKPDKNNIGIIDHSLGTKITTLTSLDNQTTVDLTDQINIYGEEFSIALKVSDPSDKVSFYSKEKQLTDGVGGFAPQKSVWPNISFK